MVQMQLKGARSPPKLSKLYTYDSKYTITLPVLDYEMRNFRSVKGINDVQLCVFIPPEFQ